MLYNLLLPYISKLHLANLFHYITFRSGLAILLSFTTSILICPYLIKIFKKLQRQGQPIRDYVPEHKSKSGTPTMGGVIIIASTLFSTLLLVDLTNYYIWIVIFVLLSLGTLGFIDDYKKLMKNNHYGVSGKKKLFFQTVVSCIACICIQKITKDSSSHLAFPFFKNLLVDLGYFYIPFGMFVIIGSSNAVNLTDGLDGLAIVPVVIVAGSFGIISYLVGNSIYANYLQIPYVQNTGELTVFCSSLVGAGLGFLWFNAEPAEIFMGDVGSLSLGGVIGVISVIAKHEIVLGIIGGLFVIEALSVIMQVYYFKVTKGKRIFKMAPLHHHFQKSGWSESKIVIRFWIISIVFALIGLASLKLR